MLLPTARTKLDPTHTCQNKLRKDTNNKNKNNITGPAIMCTTTDNDNANANDNVNDDNDININDDKTKEEQHPIQSGIPPWHSFAFITALLAIIVPHLPTFDSLDEFATVAILTHRKFPDLMSLQTLGLIRLAIAAIALSLTFYLACINSGWDVYPNYKPHSKLRRVFIRLEGIGTLCPFTSWCWTILGVGFLCRGILTLAAASVAVVEDQNQRPWWASWASIVVDKANVDKYILKNHYFLRATFVLWELTGPFAILVSSVIKYVIWPEVAKGGKPHNLAGVRNQLQHNCNTIFTLLEVTLLGGIPVEFSHLSMATLMGILYIGFTWIMANFYFGNAKTTGPQYIYWFMDTTLGINTTKALAALAFALTLFFVLFSFVIHAFLGGGGGGGNGEDINLVHNVLFLVVGTFTVCRFKN